MSSKHFFEDIDLIEKQNRDKLVRSLVCTTIALIRTISYEELGRYTNARPSP